MYESKLRLRISAGDAHYGGGLVDGAHMLKLFGDVATELLIYSDGDEGLFVAYDNIYYSKGVLAKGNAPFVTRLVNLAQTFDRSVATPLEARKLLGILSL